MQFEMVFSILGHKKFILPSKKVTNTLHQDKVLAKITHLPLSPLQKNRDLFQDLVRSIIFQQLSGKAADTIYARFVNLFSQKKVTPRKILNKSIEQMRTAGVSNQKAGYIQNIARAALQQKFNTQNWESLSDEAILEILTNIKGVGRWTAQMILMFSLHRQNVFPTGDVSIQHAMKELYVLKAEGKALIQKMEKISQQWHPYRSWAARYFWAWKDQII